MHDKLVGYPLKENEMAAELEEVAAGNSGQQVQGAVKNYLLDGVNDATGNTESIAPYDSGNILGTVPPGKVGLKLVDGTQQRATQIIADATAGQVGNALVSTYAPNVDPTAPAGSNPADGLSQAPNHE
jgi:hypothetical protein